jgi:hypothetical protein
LDSSLFSVASRLIAVRLRPLDYIFKQFQPPENFLLCLKGKINSARVHRPGDIEYHTYSALKGQVKEKL